MKHTNEPSYTCHLDWIREMPDEDVLMGRLQVFGGSMHVFFIRVETDEHGVQVATNDPHGRLDDAYAADPDEAYESVTVPGFDGEYVPFAIGFKS